jgi:outer membrane protein
MNKLVMFASTILVMFFAVLVANAQEIPDEYLSAAIKDNLVLKERKIGLRKSLIALSQAKSLFLPTTTIEGQYTLAKGGRSIDIPVGDLLNPVYKSLNQLTNSDGFAMVPNVSEQLNPNNFYDLRLRTTLPLYTPELRINRKISEQQIALQESEIDTYKRELIKETKIAYYNYVLSGKAILIYKNALEVVNENLRANQALLSNGKGLPAYVSRAEAEVNQVKSQLQAAVNNHLNAKAAFNFILNRPFSDSVKVVEPGKEGIVSQLAKIAPDNISAREELKTLALSKQVNDNVIRMNRDFRKPRINLFMDLASQGFDFEVNRKSVYYLAGLQLQVPVFTGRRNLYKIQQSTLDGEALAFNTANTLQQLQLSALVSKNNLQSVGENYLTSLKQQEAARQYFKLISKGYTEGVNSFIEFLDARNQLTNSNLQAVINQFKVLVAEADYERETASYIFK